MNEEQAVLDFFSKKENLPLALNVANQVDNIRQKMNNDFWLALCKRIATTAPEWRVSITEDRNKKECLVGLHLQPEEDQKIYLRPMMEQQYLGDTLRIYYGLMWSVTPMSEQKQLPTLQALSNSFQEAGFKNNESFLAWQWTSYYPRDMEFLLRFSTDADALLDEVSSLIETLLETCHEDLQLANQTLRKPSRNPAVAVVSLDKLRANLER